MSKTLFPFHILAKPIGPLCNLACDYCFYLSKEDLFPGDSGRTAFTMSDEVLEAYVHGYIEAQPDGVTEVNFAWQGGEPTLLGNDFFQKAIDLQKKYAREGMTVSNAVQTNGTLIDGDRAEFFKDNGFLLGISVDGPEELHNRYRRDRAGKGSFKQVMKGIEALQKAGTDFNTLTVIQNDNAEHPVEVYDFLKSIGSTFLQFIPIVEPVYDLEGCAAGAPTAGTAAPAVGPSFYPGKTHGRTVSAEAWGSFLIEVFRRWAVRDIGRIYVQHFDLFLSRYMGYPASLCVHAEACGSAMAIEHDGGLYSCDHYVFPENYLGNVVSDDVAAMAAGDRQRKFGEYKREGLPYECRACPYLALCAGGCPKDRIIRTKTGNLNHLCKGYFNFFDFTRPYFQAMAAALNNRRPASEFRSFLPPVSSFSPGRNDLCPCLSGKKYKACCGR